MSWLSTCWLTSAVRPDTSELLYGLHPAFTVTPRHFYNCGNLSTSIIANRLVPFEPKRADFWRDSTRARIVAFTLFTSIRLLLCLFSQTIEQVSAVRNTHSSWQSVFVGFRSREIIDWYVTFESNLESTCLQFLSLLLLFFNFQILKFESIWHWNDGFHWGKFWKFESTCTSIFATSFCMMMTIYKLDYFFNFWIHQWNSYKFIRKLCQGFQLFFRNSGVEIIADFGEEDGPEVDLNVGPQMCLKAEKL